MDVHTCPVCAAPFALKAIGRPARHCSKKCADKASAARRRTAARVTLCQECGGLNPLPVRGAARKFCSAECRAACHARLRVVHRYAGQCAQCGYAFSCAKAGQRFCSIGCKNRAHLATRYANHEYAPQSNGHRARALRYGAAYVAVNPADIFARDSWVCGLCAGQVDALLRWPHPFSASIDHVIPLSRGGDHIPENLQCAHLRCNIVKGAPNAGSAPDTERAQAQAR